MKRIRATVDREMNGDCVSWRRFTARILTVAIAAATSLALSAPSFAQDRTEQGIPVTDALVRARCGACHAADERGNMPRVSWSRATPEGWQAAVRRMVTENGVEMSPADGRAIVRYLSARHGLAPDEARAVMYSAERRARDEAGTVNELLLDACARCHQAARALSWRRPAADWRQFAERHAARYQFTLDPKAVAALIEAAPLHTREWEDWTARARMPELAGRWLVTAHLAGHGDFRGEMEVEATGPDEFATRTHLQAVDGTAVFSRSGRGLVFSGTAWRGRSTGGSAATAPGDPSNDAQETMLIAADGTHAEGRWFWGQYQELGFDVTMRRPGAEPSLLLVEPPSLKIGSNANRIRLIGDGFPASVTPADLSAGPGATVRRIVSASPGEIVAEVDVAGDAVAGTRTVAFRSSTLAGALAIYDRVDYVTVRPDSSLAAFGSQTNSRGYQQFEAIGYHRGPDGKRQTADDVALGPVQATWSMEIFYEVDQTRQGRVGTLSPDGFFTPAAANPGANYDVWIIATAKNDRSVDDKPLVGKSYLVVTVPTYTFDGRTYIRDLDRWIEEEHNP
jgi:quinohemoprotein amine dehydrogenase